MSRLLLARGSRGELVKKVQRGLAFEERDIDGRYGGQTFDGVSAFQVNRGLDKTGAVDTDTWSGITTLPVPSLFERVLGITADFEGHGFDLAQGNFDGAGITWGIIGFTLRHGEIPAIVLEMDRTRPDLLTLAFGENTKKLLQVMKAPLAKQMEFADSVSIGQTKARLAEPWLSSFALFGRLEEVKQTQLRRAREKYFSPAMTTAARLGFVTELGAALCFDIHVQNGSVKPAVRDQILGQTFSTERKKRVALANAVADASIQRFREDVRSRKLTLATGSGKVHGASFKVPDWGLDELPAA
ncbi:MAG: peptidoglycan-binding domain-containing protein [Bryobacteraceae bacterium]|nr:peptidoglycan-binding domain-containing protein [Bryobacteraceae bacterium]